MLFSIFGASAHSSFAQATPVEFNSFTTKDTATYVASTLNTQCSKRLLTDILKKYIVTDTIYQDTLHKEIYFNVLHLKGNRQDQVYGYKFGDGKPKGIRNTLCVEIAASDSYMRLNFDANKIVKIYLFTSSTFPFGT